MTEADIQAIEAHLGFSVPPAYRKTVLDYPFAPGSFAEELMLPDCVDQVLELNEAGLEPADLEHPFCVGCDGGEERYHLDAGRPDSPVFVLRLETGDLSVLTATWDEYLELVRTTEAELAGDEAATPRRPAGRRWWEFWR